MSIESLPVYFYRNDTNTHVGYVYCNMDTNEYSIALQKEKMPKYCLPIQMYGLNGTDVPTSEEVYAWLQGRVVPPTRQDIAYILRDYNMTAYNVWELLKHGNGNVGTDSIYIGVEWHPYARKRKQAGFHIIRQQRWKIKHKSCKK